ncbi:MAG: hypothetical protein UV61_C0026G0002 [Candidatus Gottesmanbacteria bacterium GW2011_GWB1_43_11]|uniref:Uncharacterized protein n=1 Tax=Candidatus Gottesmanbacteria bacterium GW2011_GWB1_43_11 TaxID=1618446 RepID=A0A0G1CGT6_9BACT|nr:MAG: hypothetical protein UV04_C0024G0009 [Candidatus Gottesmanbacteria bacterium GW2011_GWA2_42_16]KKS84669.1 MAG: hypothetical protein UV61_C0026G0002 [Candidatus Gottesmanbacteria bacterium GW2011_GWB1_43_11]OGG10290.1 MAG: hypothetical protein A2699_00155 [Candidatus Gottesmanbacteria bacterium RIFCSPHIGHO2_01_FULL_43_15]HCM37493.1 hypothetical protein [Patescibacteria group bacterium]
MAVENKPSITNGLARLDIRAQTILGGDTVPPVESAGIPVVRDVGRPPAPRKASGDRAIPDWMRLGDNYGF